MIKNSQTVYYLGRMGFNIARCGKNVICQQTNDDSDMSTIANVAKNNPFSTFGSNYVN